MKLNSELDRALTDLKRLGKYEHIQQELDRAEQKHPDYPTNMFKQLAIMLEEAGEVTKAVLHLDDENGTLEHVREELIQTAAMCMRMLQNLPTHQLPDRDPIRDLYGDMKADAS